MLNIKELKAGDELVCIDREGYVNQDNGCARIRKQILKGPIVVFEITKYGVSLDSSGLQIPLDSLKYFKKKEQSQYTFNDLIDVVTRAYKDKLLSMYSVGGDGAVVLKYWIDSNPTRVLRETIIDNVIKHIQSLYKETFVIEDYEDIKRIKNNANITLSNGNRIEQAVLENQGDYVVFNDSADNFYTFGFIVLKGATVEQERGRDD